jgi:SAM-dependent methyltransferase
LLSRYYDWLSRYQRVSAWASRAGRARLTVDRRLGPSDARLGGTDGVHDALVVALGSMPRAPRVVDAGCGLGGTIFFLHGRYGGEYDGVTLSGVQRDRAVAEARRRGVSAACRFHVADFDEGLEAIAPRGADLVVAIESLAHASTPERSIATLARTLTVGGRLAIVDDVPAARLRDDDPDLRLFRAGWQCPVVARHADLLHALTACGLRIEHDENLTPRLVLRGTAALERLVRANRGIRRWASAGGAGLVLDALHGGLMLERLYRRGMMEYRLIVARR